MISPLLEHQDLTNDLCDLNLRKMVQTRKIENLAVLLSDEPTSVINAAVDNKMGKFVRLRPAPKST